MAERAMKNIEIAGWGADLDPKNRPAVPKEKTPPHGTGAHWIEPEQQVPKVKVYHSIERPGLTPVFGTSCPPIGLSGRIRDVAYKFSEARLSHWMLLLFADRVNVVEGLIDDFRRGHIPNIFAEMGLRKQKRRHPKLPRTQ